MEKEKIVLDASEIEQPIEKVSMMGMFKSIKEISESPLGKIGLKVLEKELGVAAHEKDIAKKPFGRALFAFRDFLQGTWWVAVLFSLSMMLVFIMYLWLKSRLGLE